MSPFEQAVQDARAQGQYEGRLAELREQLREVRAVVGEAASHKETIEALRRAVEQRETVLADRIEELKAARVRIADLEAELRVLRGSNPAPPPAPAPPQAGSANLLGARGG